LKRLSIVLLVFVLCVAAGLPAFGAGLRSTESPGLANADYVPGEILVKYRSGVASETTGELRKMVGASEVGRMLDAGFERIKIGQEDIGAALQKLRSSELVEYAEPNYIRGASWTPDDPEYDARQWNFSRTPDNGGINMEAAWDIERGGSSSVIVAILDTGVAYENRGVYKLASDLDETRFVPGYDFVNEDPYADDDNGHGTHVCGTVAQSTNNNLMVAGIAFKCSIMPVKVMDRAGQATDDVLVQGLRYAADHGADVINMSLGGKAPSSFLEDGIDYASEKGVVLCAASGNDARAGVDYPAAYPACIAVGASNINSARAAYSNYGSALDVVAPGGDSSAAIWQQTYMHEGNPSSQLVLKGYQGTSMATPHVAGIAALVKSHHSSWSAGDVRNAVVSTCRNVGAGGWDIYTGNGLVDAAAALKAKRLNTPVVSEVSPGHAKAGSAVKGVVITGGSFSSPMDVMLEREGEVPVVASSVSVKSEGRLICNFNLSGAQPGLWTLKVQNSALKSDVVDGAFMVDPENNHTWFLAEGSTDWGFEEFILIQNPNDVAANALVTLQTNEGQENPFPVAVPANSRVTVNLNSVIPGKDVSARIDADQDVICERSMYWGGRVEGTDTIGIEAPSYSWYLAEGTTAHGFDTYLLIMNPDDSDAKVKVTYMTDTGPVEKPEFPVPARTRYTIDVKGDLPDRDFSLKVIADKRVIAERSMYWDGKRGGHCSIGTTSPAVDWYLAEGSTDWGFDEYVLLQNPGSAAAKIDLTYMTGRGPEPQPTISLAAGSRETVHVNEVFPGEDVSVKVNADRGIVAERSMYWNNGTGKAGHDAIGVTQPREQCFLAEGSTDWGFDEWVLVQNPNDSTANVSVEYMTEEGLKTRAGFTMAAGSRFSIHVNADLPPVDTSTYVRSDLPILAERSMYWSNKGGGHVSTGLLK